jgi:hypothetical protein
MANRTATHRQLGTTNIPNWSELKSPKSVPVQTNHSRSNGKINPLCLAVSGRYDGLPYDGIKVTPLLEKEKILIAISVNSNGLKTVAHVAFPAKKQTPDQYQQILKRVIGKKLQVLI